MVASKRRALRMSPRTMMACALLACLLETGNSSRAQPSSRGDDLRRLSIAEELDGSKFALVVGVDSYDGALSALSFARKDADDFRMHLTRWGLGDSTITCLSDATTDVLGSAIDTLTKSAAAKTVLFFFAGHGNRMQKHDWLLPLPQRDRPPSGNRYEVDALIGGLEESRPKRAILFFDACRDRPSELRGTFPTGIGSVQRKPAESGIAWLYACEANQSSVEDPKLRNGVFTHFLLQGLAGKADVRGTGQITFEDLKQYVRGAVKKHVNDHFAGRTQWPTGLSSTPDMVLVKTSPRLRPGDQNAVSAAIRLANQYFRQGKWREAAREANKALLLDEKNGSANLILGKARVKLGDFHEARRALRDALEQGVREADTVLKQIEPRAKSASEQRPGRYLARVDDAVLRDGDTVRCASLLSSVRAQHERPATASAQQSELKASGWSSAQKVVADTHEEVVADGKTLPAGMRLQEILALLDSGKADEAEDAAIQFTLANPGSADGSYLLGHIYTRQGRLEDAIREYQEALRIKPDLAAARAGLMSVLGQKAPADASQLASEAVSLVAAARYALAEEKAREALARDDASAAAHFALGGVFVQQKRFTDALSEYERARTLEQDLPGLDAAVNEVKVAQEGEAIRLEARTLYEQLEGKPNMAEAKAKLGQFQRAGITNDWLHLLMGRIAEREGDPRRAMREYQEAELLQPGREEAAIGVQRVLPMIPARDTGVLRVSARELMGAGKYAEAEPGIRELAARAPDSPDAHVLLGDLYRAQGRLNAAMVEYLLAEQMDPHHPSALLAAQETKLEQARRSAVTFVLEAYQHLTRDDALAVRNAAYRAISLDPGNAQAHALLGNALLWLDAPEEAADELSNAVDLQRSQAHGTDLPLVHIGRGTQAWIQGINAQREAELKLEQARRPEQGDDPEKLKVEAGVLLDQAAGSYKQAQQEFQDTLQTAVKGAPSLEKSEQLVARNGLGAILHALGKLEQLKGESHPDRFALATRAYSRADAYYREAEKQLVAAASQDVAYQIAHYNLGNNYVARGLIFEALRRPRSARRMWKQAELELRRAIALYQGNAGSQALLGAILYRRNRPDEGAEWINRAKELGLKEHFAFRLVKNQIPRKHQDP
jgi:tetratricopeptide (TPR) repeat protein